MALTLAETNPSNISTMSWVNRALSMANAALEANILNRSRSSLEYNAPRPRVSTSISPIRFFCPTSGAHMLAVILASMMLLLISSPIVSWVKSTLSRLLRARRMILVLITTPSSSDAPSSPRTRDQKGSRWLTSSGSLPRITAKKLVAGKASKAVSSINARISSSSVKPLSSPANRNRAAHRVSLSPRR